MNIDKLKSKVSLGKIDEVIHELITVPGDEESQKELILLSSRNHLNQRNRRTGIVSFEEYTIVENKLVLTLLSLIEDLDMEPKSELSSTKNSISSRKVLFCESNPLRDRNLLSNIEFREIEEIITNDNFNLDVISKFGLSIVRFMRVINEFQPNIVHFSAFANDKGIYFHSKNDQSDFIKSDTFQKYLEIVVNQIECIFFNTFISEDLARKISFEKVLVIGFNGIINSLGAIEFATGFYTSLGYKNEYDAAYKSGVQTLMSGEFKAVASSIYAYYDGKKIKL